MLNLTAMDTTPQAIELSGYTISVELLTHSLSYLSIKDLCCTSGTCKTFYRIAKELLPKKECWVFVDALEQLGFVIDEDDNILYDKETLSVKSIFPAIRNTLTRHGFTPSPFETNLTQKIIEKIFDLLPATKNKLTNLDDQDAMHGFLYQLCTLEDLKLTQKFFDNYLDNTQKNSHLSTMPQQKIMDMLDSIENLTLLEYLFQYVMNPEHVVGNNALANSSLAKRHYLEWLIEKQKAQKNIERPSRGIDDMLDKTHEYGMLGFSKFVLSSHKHPKTYIITSMSVVSLSIIFFIYLSLAQYSPMLDSEYFS